MGNLKVKQNLDSQVIQVDHPDNHDSNKDCYQIFAEGYYPKAQL